MTILVFCNPTEDTAEARKKVQAAFPDALVEVFVEGDLWFTKDSFRP